MKTLPLAHRLPNPPPTFVGRERELAWCRAAVERAPVVVVCGRKGLGKSALVFALMQRHFAERVDRTIYVSYRGADPHEHVALPLVRALMRAKDVRDVDWAELLQAPDALGALAIDLMEEGRFWAVLDDVSEGQGVELAEFLRHLSRYARHSRALVTTSVAPEYEELEGQLLELSGLTLEDLEALGRQFDPERAADAARSAQGSPLEVRRALGRPTRIAPPPDEDAMRLERLRAIVASGAFDELRRALEESGDALLRSGHAIGLWSILADADDPRVEDFRLRVALELGDREVLARVHAPSEQTPSRRLLWAAALLAKGRLNEGAAVAESVRRECQDDPELAFRSGFLHAQLVGNAGRLNEARAILDSLTPHDVGAAARRDALRAQVLSLLDEPERAFESVSSARQKLSELGWPERAAVGVRVARALYNLGRFRDAASVLGHVQGDEVRGSVRFDIGRGLRFFRACLALDCGELDRARSELIALEPYAGATSPLRASLLVARGTLGAITGDLEELDRAIRELDAMELSSQIAHERNVLVLRARLLRRQRADDVVDTPADGSLFARSARLHRARLDLHLGARSPRSILDELATLPTHPELRVVLRTIRAEALLAAGEPNAALVEIRAALTDATEHAFGVHELEAAQVQCDVLTVLGDRGALERGARELEARARALGVSRIESLATLHLGADHAALEALAAKEQGAPEAARRARGLLGGRVNGVIDQLVLARATIRIPRPSDDGSTWLPRPGIDLSGVLVWHPNGAAIDLSKQPLLFNILAQLVARGGAATKEDLVLAVWGEKSYHPLRHDNRLQAAVRKLRRRIELDPTKPCVLLTTADGYSLGAVRVVE